MPKHTLFVCKSCHRSSAERPKEQPADGTHLLEQLNTLGAEQVQSNEFVIQPVGCLWTCENPYAVAFLASQNHLFLWPSVINSSLVVGYWRREKRT